LYLFALFSLVCSKYEPEKEKSIVKFTKTQSNNENYYKTKLLVSVFFRIKWFLAFGFFFFYLVGQHNNNEKEKKDSRSFCLRTFSVALERCETMAIVTPGGAGALNLLAGRPYPPPISRKKDKERDFVDQLAAADCCRVMAKR